MAVRVPRERNIILCCGNVEVEGLAGGGDLQMKQTVVGFFFASKISVEIDELVVNGRYFGEYRGV